MGAAGLLDWYAPASLERATIDAAQMYDAVPPGGEGPLDPRHFSSSLSMMNTNTSRASSRRKPALQPAGPLSSGDTASTSESASASSPRERRGLYTRRVAARKRSTSKPSAVPKDLRAPWAALLPPAMARIGRERGRWFAPRPVTAADLAAIATNTVPPGYLEFVRSFGGADTIEKSFPYFGGVQFLPARVVLRERATLDATPSWPKGALPIASTFDPPDACLGSYHALCKDGVVRFWTRREGLVRDEHPSFDAMLTWFLRSVAGSGVTYDSTTGFSF